jgi:hypothetical protein
MRPPIGKTRELATSVLFVFMFVSMRSCAGPPVYRSSEKNRFPPWWTAHKRVAVIAGSREVTPLTPATVRTPNDPPPAVDPYDPVELVRKVLAEEGIDIVYYPKHGIFVDEPKAERARQLLLNAPTLRNKGVTVLGTHAPIDKSEP